MAIAAGTRLNYYEVISLLGAGGMGEVWRARDTRLEREVAIKVLPASFANDVDRLKRFEQEARATSALNHPNILTIHDIGTHDGSPYIVAELLDGAELREEMKAGALPARKAIDYALQTARGLSAAHEKGITHRDLKPENLFVTTDGRVKILDFGLAKLRPPKLAGEVDSEAPTRLPLTDPGVVMGTVGYMSPEQVRGQEADHRADLFAFGLILYEMLSGKRAFNGASMADLMSAILKEDPPELGATNAKINPALDKIVRRCLEKKPERRFQSASDLGFALGALSTLSSSGANRTEAVPTIEAVTMAKRGARRERVAWLAAMVLLLGLLGFAWAYFTRQPITNEARVLKFSITPPENASFDNIALSPDGRWLAYASDELGKFEVYVQRFPDRNGKRQISTNGGLGPHWRRDGKELFYYAADGKLMAVPVGSGESFEPGAAVALFEFRSGSSSPTTAPYTVTGDGQRFLVNAIVDAEPHAALNVVVNWAAGVKKN